MTHTYNVVSAVWFGTIGIVRVRPEHGADKFYIGSGLGHAVKKMNNTLQNGECRSIQQALKNSLIPQNRA
jgi:hypothetical protein